MKQAVFLSLGLAVAIVIIFYSRERSFSPHPASADAAPRILNRQPIAPSRRQSVSRDESISQNPLEETLALIRVKLAQLSAVSKADKEAEDELMTGLLVLVTDDNAGEITRALSADELHSRFGLAAFQHWLKTAPLAAADWVAARSDASDEQAWAVAHQLVEDDAALKRYCSRLPDTGWRQVFLKQAALAATRRDPIEAIQLVQQIDSGSAQLDLLQTTICTWMTDNPTTAATWIGQVQDPLLREELVHIGARALAARDALGAIDWLLSSLPAPSKGAGPAIDDTLQDIIATWVETAPTQAASLVAQLSPGDLREATVKLVWDRWSQRDPAAAANWLRGRQERDGIRAGAGVD